MAAPTQGHGPRADRAGQRIGHGAAAGERAVERTRRWCPRRQGGRRGRPLGDGRGRRPVGRRAGATASPVRERPHTVCSVTWRSTNAVSSFEDLGAANQRRRARGDDRSSPRGEPWCTKPTRTGTSTSGRPARRPGPNSSGSSGGTPSAGAVASGASWPPWWPCSPGSGRPRARWHVGGRAEERVGRLLSRAVGRTGIVLHDRAVPHRRANIDHLAIVPSGVWVIDTKRYHGRLRRTRRPGRLVGRRTLVVNGHDRGQLVTAALRQRALVRSAAGPDVEVRAVLCFEGAEWGRRGRPFVLARGHGDVAHRAGPGAHGAGTARPRRPGRSRRPPCPRLPALRPLGHLPQTDGRLTEPVVTGQALARHGALDALLHAREQ